MAPLFGESNEMKEIGKQMQNLSEQIASLKQQLDQKNTEVENLQKQLGDTKSAGPSAGDTAQLQRAQNEISSLRQQLDMLQAQAKQASQSPGAATASATASAPTSAPSGGVKSAMAGMGAGATETAPAASGGLTVGGSAWVTRAGGLPLRMRSEPSLNASILDRLAPGTQMTLLAGPQNADGHAWWHMRTSDGREGWVAGEDLRVQPD